MPGFSLIYTPKQEIAALTSKCESALERMLHDGRYKRRTVDQDAFSALFETGYEGYPVQTWNTDDCLLMLEGCVYGGDASKLKQLLDEDFRTPGGIARAREYLREWTLGADGDFVIVYISKRPPRGVIVAIDPIGQLPVFWRLDHNRLLVSREVKFVARLSEALQPDKAAVTETLLFASPLEDRTLLKGVSHLPPGGVLSWEAENEPEPRLSREVWDFTAQDAGTRSTDGLVERLVSEFMASCRRRAQAFEGRPFVLSLSGGLDSRGVAAAFQGLGHTIQSRTFTDGSHHREQDTKIAMRIASIAGFDWKLVQVSPPALDAVERLIAMKDGLNSAGMAHAEQYLSSIVRDCGSEAILLGGAGGDLALPPILPYRRLKSVRDLSMLLLSRRTKFDPATVAQLTGTTTNDLEEQLTSILTRYPEGDLADRFLHFFFTEFEVRGTFEGIDRNRGHLWTVSPYYGRPFFATATTAPSAWKRRRRLQVAFLQRLNREIARVPSANSGLVPGSGIDQARQRLREFTLSSKGTEIIWFAQRRLRSAGGFIPPTPVGQRLLDTMRESAVIDSVFDRQRLAELVQRPMLEEQFWSIYTVVRYLASLDARSSIPSI